MAYHCEEPTNLTLPKSWQNQTLDSKIFDECCLILTGIKTRLENRII
jgi:hypothetical protein